MPFRSNAFGEQIAQPGTDFSEIDNMFMNKFGRPPAIYGAHISSEADDEYKFGGSLNDNGYEPEDEDDVLEQDDPREINFDGFESVEACREWLISLDINPRTITVD
jgi:hypothetical protein